MEYNDENVMDESCSKKNFILGQEFDTQSTQESSITQNKVFANQCALVAKEALNVSFKLPVDAFQTPIIGVEHCGVKLRQIDSGRSFPDVMLIQFQGYF